MFECKFLGSICTVYRSQVLDVERLNASLGLQSSNTCRSLQGEASFVGDQVVDASGSGSQETILLHTTPTRSFIFRLWLFDNIYAAGWLLS